MELQEALNVAKTGFLNNIRKDSARYNAIITALFGQSCTWDNAFLKRFEASLASADTEGCTSGTPGCITEKMYNPKELLFSLFRCMLEIYARKSNKQYADFELCKLNSEIVTLYNLIQLINNREITKEQHIIFMKNLLLQLQQVNAPICYHAGYPGHTIYINYFRRSDRLYASICNLGEGSDKHKEENFSDGIKLVYPVLLEIVDVELHLTCIYRARTYNGEISHDKKQELIGLIYDSGRRVEAYEDPPEVAQRTANCVIKNYMQAMACRLKDKDDYLGIFDCIRSVLGSHIMNQDNYIYKRDVSHLHRCISSSQNLYGGATCEDLQNFPLHLATVRTETINHPSAIDNKTARIAGSGMLGIAGVFFSYQLLKENKDMSKKQKLLIILTTGAICCIVGERLGNAISQPRASQKTIEEDVEVPAKNITTCREGMLPFSVPHVSRPPIMFRWPGRVDMAKSRSRVMAAPSSSHRQGRERHNEEQHRRHKEERRTNTTRHHPY